MSLNKKGFLDYFSEEFIVGIVKIFKFAVIYTIFFMILLVTLKFALPFVVAFIIALMLKPIKNRILSLNKKLKKMKLSSGFVSLNLTLAIILICLTIAGIVGFQLYSQIIRFLRYITDENTINTILETTDNILSKNAFNINNLDPKIVEKINEAIMSFVQVLSGMATILGKNLLNIIASIPSGVIVTVITVVSTYFFTKDIDKINESASSIFSYKGHKLIKKIKDRLSSVFSAYIKAYILIMIAVGVISSIIFSLAKIEYAIPIAILTGLLDILPLIGAGMVYLILIISSYFAGKSTVCVILVIGFLIVALVRQLLEQNLVASFIGVHPLVMITGLFIAFTPLGFGGMFYFIGGCLVYKAVK